MSDPAPALLSIPRKNALVHQVGFQCSCYFGCHVLRLSWFPFLKVSRRVCVRVPVLSHTTMVKERAGKREAVQKHNEVTGVDKGSSQ